MKFTILGQPASKKNSMQICPLKYKDKATGRLKTQYRLIPSASYKKYEKMCEGQIPELKIDYPCNIKAIYYRGDRRRIDISNLHSALHDVLVKYGCLEDDNCKIVVSTDGSRVAYDKGNPRTEVEITRLEDYVDPFE